MLAILLESDTLYLYGSPEESAGTEIRGCLELRFKETTRVKSISLEFMGLLKQHWTEGSQRRHGKLKKIMYQHDWVFLPERNWPHILKANTTYRYPFDLVLPGHMAESITSHSSGGLGSLTYEFKATVTRPFASKNMVIHRPIQVIRCGHTSSPSSMDHGYYYGDDNSNSSRVINKTFGDKVNYRIKLDTDRYQRGQPIRLHFSFKPLLPDLQIDHISCFLKEYTTLVHLDDNNGTSSTPPLIQQSRIISLARDDRFPCHGVKWEETETVVVPRSAHSVLLDVDHPWMRIEHKLRLTIRFIQLGDRQVSELRVTIPIKVLEPTPLLSTPVNTTIPVVSDDLPRYEDACLTPPYDPHYRFRPTSPSPSLPSLVSYTGTLSPSYNDDDGDHYWQQLGATTTSTTSTVPATCDYFSYQPSYHSIYLERAPSYSTVIRS